MDPSSFLPPLSQGKNITLSSTKLLTLIGKLRATLDPKRAGLNSIEVQIDSGYSSTAEDSTTTKTRRIDEKIESNYAKSWLMSFLKLTLFTDWAEEGHLGGQLEVDRRYQVIEAASALIAHLSETSVSGAIHRSIVLPTCQRDSNPISITLLDALPTAEDPTGVGLQSWGASIILARKFSFNPDFYRIRSASRILELGSGTGLLALAAAKLLQRKEADHKGEMLRNVIVATDFHEAVLANLQRNVDDNDVTSSASTTEPTTIDVLPLDWSYIHTLPTSVAMDPPLNGRFDLILGGDIIYREFHSLWIHSCVSRFLAHPTSLSPDPVFILIAPLRPTHTLAIVSITLIFPHANDLVVRLQKPEDGGEAWRLAILSIEGAEREYGVGRADEGGYRIYRIGWV